MQNRPILLVRFGRDQLIKCSDSAFFKYSGSVPWGYVIHIYCRKFFQLKFGDICKKKWKNTSAFENTKICRIPYSTEQNQIKIQKIRFENFIQKYVISAICGPARINDIFKLLIIFNTGIYATRCVLSRIWLVFFR